MVVVVVVVDTVDPEDPGDPEVPAVLEPLEEKAPDLMAESVETQTFWEVSPLLLDLVLAVLENVSANLTINVLLDLPVLLELRVRTDSRDRMVFPVLMGKVARMLKQKLKLICPVSTVLLDLPEHQVHLDLSDPPDLPVPPELQAPQEKAERQVPGVVLVKKVQLDRLENPERKAQLVETDKVVRVNQERKDHQDLKVLWDLLELLGLLLQPTIKLDLQGLSDHQDPKVTTAKTAIKDLPDLLEAKATTLPTVPAPENQVFHHHKVVALAQDRLTQLIHQFNPVELVVLMVVLVQFPQ